MKSIALFGLGLFAAALIWWLAPVGGGGKRVAGVGPSVQGVGAEPGARSLPTEARAPHEAPEGAQAPGSGSGPAAEVAQVSGQRESALVGGDLLRVVDTTGAPRSAVVRVSLSGRELVKDWNREVAKQVLTRPYDLRLEVPAAGLDLTPHTELGARLEDGLAVVFNVMGKGLVPCDFASEELREVDGALVLEVERMVSLTYRIDLDGGNAVFPDDIQRHWIGRGAERKLWLRKAGSALSDGVPESWLPASFVLEAEGYLPEVVAVPTLAESLERAHPPQAGDNAAVLDLGVMQLTPVNPPLSGRLVLSAGQPLRYADYAVSVAGGHEVSIGRTGPDGKYSIRGLPSGTYDFELRLKAVGELEGLLPRGVQPGPQGEQRLPFELVELEVRPSVRVQALGGWPGDYRLRTRTSAPGYPPMDLGEWHGANGPKLRFLSQVDLGTAVHVLGESRASRSEVDSGYVATPPVSGSVEVASLPWGASRSGTLVFDLADHGTVRFVAPEGAATWRFELHSVDTGLEAGALWGSPHGGNGAKGPTIGQTVPLASGVWRARFVETDHATSALQPATEELEFELAPGEHRVVQVPVVAGGRIQLDIVNELAGSSWATFLALEFSRVGPDGKWQTVQAPSWFLSTDGELKAAPLRKDRTRRFVSQALRPGTYRLVVPDRLDETFEIAPDGLVTLQVSMD